MLPASAPSRASFSIENRFASHCDSIAAAASLEAMPRDRERSCQCGFEIQHGLQAAMIGKDLAHVVGREEWTE